jgi:hypothetical protein
MKHMLALVTIISLANATLAFAAAAADTPHAKLMQALLCKGVSESLSALVKGGSNFAAGYAVQGFGEDMSYKSMVILRDPITIAGAKTNAVIWSLDPNYFEFNAFLFSEFTGDYKAVVKALKLEPTKDFNESSMGRFVSVQASENACPETIVLTPKENGWFLLGCGWCNGG